MSPKTRRSHREYLRRLAAADAAARCVVCRLPLPVVTFRRVDRERYCSDVCRQTALERIKV
jgi:hypothetical protein